jgi:hypothetical protein
LIPDLYTSLIQGSRSALIALIQIVLIPDPRSPLIAGSRSVAIGRDLP